jgi:DNA polymerase I-like protein with 3'-5' exonuclease and polymerase domains
VKKKKSLQVEALPMDMPAQCKILDPELIASDWRPPDPSTWPRFSEAKRIGIDTEFRDATLTTLGVGVRRDPNEHYVFGVSVAVEDGPKMYLPFAHDGGDNLDKAQVVGYLKDEFKNFKGDVAGANLQCDLDWLWEMGCNMPAVHRFYDVQVADPLINELERSYSLDAISKRRGFGGKNEDGLRAAAQKYGIDAKADMWRLPARHVGPYAEDDGVLPLRILRQQEHDMDRDGLLGVWDKESRLLPILLRMTRKGVRVNMDRVHVMERWAQAREAEAWAIVKRETGVEIPVGESMNVKLLASALRAAGLDHLIGQNSRGDSITKELLHGIGERVTGNQDANSSGGSGYNSSIGIGKGSENTVTHGAISTDKHPVVLAILDARKMAKLISTYVNGTYKAAIKHGEEYRVHTVFNQIRKTEDGKNDGDEGKTKGVAYGRLSSSTPNMQNQPAADRLTGDNLLGCMWRSVYEAEHGELWCSNDLKQQEPRWSFHYGAMLERAVDKWGNKLFPDVRGALALCERLNANPNLDCYEPLVDQTGQPRPICKVMWLARAYGQGNGTLCENLKLPTEQYVFVPRRMKSVPVNSEQGEQAMAMEGHVTFVSAGSAGMVIINKFDGEMPFLKASAKLAEARAKERGYVTLISGRRCHFESDGKGGYEWCNKAFNRLIQGTSAEQMKENMLAVDAAGFGSTLMLQVHDELAASLASKALALKMAEVMKHAMPMEVPTVVDTECGASWGESMSLEEIIDGKKIKRQYVWNMG